MTAQRVQLAGGLALSVPDGWQQVEPPPGLALLAFDQRGLGSGSTPCLVVTRSATETLDLDEWMAGTLLVLREACVGFQLIDLTGTTLAGQDARLALITYVGEDGTELTLQHWGAIAEGWGLGLDLTCATGDFPVHRPLAQGVTDSLEWEVSL